MHVISYEMDSRPALRLTDLIIVVHEEYRSGHVCLKEVEIMEREQQELLQKIAAAGTASGEYHR